MADLSVCCRWGVGMGGLLFKYYFTIFIFFLFLFLLCCVFIFCKPLSWLTRYAALLATRKEQWDWGGEALECKEGLGRNSGTQVCHLEAWERPKSQGHRLGTSEAGKVFLYCLCTKMSELVFLLLSLYGFSVKLHSCCLMQWDGWQLPRVTMSE